ncbi:MAG: 4Fe-4S dicluster domain-containing protein [Bacteroidales bacterium]|nr:4Fe-4S dicluster domain-containing protein [Bacteroidales bacterium]MCF8390065.1 4Fe-4S dicluster domain-containing protein [Bacteroidales bacterium]
MSINRRNFFKVIGVTGVSLGLGKKLSASPEKENENEIEFYGILHDSTRCIGCQGCEYACAESNSLPEPDPEDMPLAGVVRKTNENRRLVINARETSQGELYIKNQCMHCNQPACTAACLTMAMYKTKEGPVIWRDNKCMGCRYCMVSCPYDVPKFEYHSSNPKIVKCDMCYDRVLEGKLPACVENCPAEALTFGTRRELIAEARRRINDNPDLYYDGIYGEHEAGGTGNLYISSVPFEELGLNTNLQTKPYPELTKGFLYSVPSIFILWPAILLGMHKSTKKNQNKEEDNE